jgi:tetratricopeptide (TPR) repeat protein
LHTIPLELPKPKNESDFESMCAHVYGAVYGDKLAKANGGRGQAQRGVDVYVRVPGGGTVGIQCKKYTRTKLTWKDVLDEVKKADDGRQPIRMLLIATTSDSDAALQQRVMELSDKRLAEGKFDVSVEFWEDIQCRIDAHPILQERYAPHAPGGAYHRQQGEIASLREIASETRDIVSSMAPLAEARPDSANSIVSAQLDHANALIKSGRFRDALASIEVVGRDMAPLDAHQRARWHLQRAVCLWLSRDDVVEASRLFAKAHELYPGDERMAAARIRGLMLAGDCAAAVAAGAEEAERFPLSGPVWIATANARLMLGERVALEDAPGPVRGDADVLLFASHASRHAGRLDEALELAERAATHPDAGFFNRESFLSLAVEDCAANPVEAQFGLVPMTRLNRLERAAGLFEPRHDRLFGIQSDGLPVTVAHLGFALMLLGRRQEALALVDETRGRGLDHPAFARIEIQALEETGRKAEALARAKERLGVLEVDSLAAAAEIAALLGDAGFVEKAMERAKAGFGDNTALLDHLAGLEWGSKARSMGKGKAAAMVAEAGAPEKWGLGLLCQASRIFRWADKPIEAEEVENLAVARLGDGSSPGDRLLVAETLFMARRWVEATPLYEGLLARSGAKASDLHARLLACHLETGNKGRARALLKALPDGWAENDELRRGAMDLGQSVGDWRLLRPLAERQVEREPGEASSWLFRLMVLAQDAAPAMFQSELARTPDVLEGTMRTVAQLGSLELRYGEGMKGLRRLYRLLRSNMDEPEAHSAYLLNFLMGSLPEIEEAPAVVATGCHFAFEDGEGRRESFGLDPEGMEDLPKRGGYLQAGAAEAAPFLGAAVGDEVEFPLSSGGFAMVRVVAIGSVFHRLVGESQERAGSLAGIPHVKTMRLGETGDPEVDLAKIHEEILRSKGGREAAREHYSKGALTLSLFVEMAGRSTVEACLGWPGDGPPIFVGGGLAEERESAMALLAERARPVVADASALAELARFGLGDALGALGTVLATPRTVEIVSAFCEETESDRAFGTAFDMDGRLGFVEATEEHKAARRRFAGLLKETLESRCVVEPAYGDAGEAEETRSLAKLLTKEEIDAILLAKSRGGVLLTLDGRLRALAKLYYGVEGVWPQVAVMAAMRTGTVSPARAAEFSVGQFLSNRHFVSIRPEDLCWMVAQGDAHLHSGMARLKEYLASGDTEVGSAAGLTIEFLRGVAKMNTQLGAFGEFLSHLTEAVLRRKDCPPDWLGSVSGFVEEMLLESMGHVSDYELLDRRPAEDFRRRRAFLLARAREGAERAVKPATPEAIRVRVLHCGARPCLAVDRTSPQGAAKESSG